MIALFRVLCTLFAVAAVYFYWSDNGDALFVTFVLSVCSFFLSLRYKAKSRLDAANIQRENADSDV